MKPAYFTTVLPRLLGFIFMYAVGWYIATPRASVAEGEDPSQINVIPSHRHRTQSTRESGLVAQQMQTIRNADAPIERMRKTIALANSLPASEFVAWAQGDRFDFRQGPELDVFRMILFERWLKEDPDSLIPWADKNNFGQAGRALLYLANQDPKRLINFYRNNPNEKAELRNLKEVAKKHPALALQRLQELSAAGLSNNAADAAMHLLGQLAKNSYDALEAALESLAPNLRGVAENSLCEQRLVNSFDTEIRALWERPDGWKEFQIFVWNDDIMKKLIGEMAHLPASWRVGLAERLDAVNARNAKQWLEADLEQAGFTQSQISQIRGNALSKIALSDPEFALKNLEGSAMEESKKKQLISNALRGVKGDEVKIESLISMLSSEEDKQLARDQLKLAELSRMDAKAQKPDEWLKTVGTINDFQEISYSALHQLQDWDQAKIADLRNQFNELPHDQKQNIARAVSAVLHHSGIDSGFAGDAIRYLAIHPPAADSGQNGRYNDPFMASSTYAVKLAMNDPEAATSWIKTLPAGDAKLWAQKNVAANWQQYDPRAVDQWIKTLPTTTRNEVVGYLQSQR